MAEKDDIAKKANTKLDQITKKMAGAKVDNTKKATAPKPPRTNLPLPRSIRDKIWGYLLLGENVKAEPRHKQDRPLTSDGAKTASAINAAVMNVECLVSRMHGGAHTYKFETNILATSHEIHDEALQILLQNHFVVLSFYWLGLEQRMHLAGVAIVTQNRDHVARFEKRFTKQCLRVHLHTRKKLAAKDRVLRSCLMLREDFETFCDDIFWNMLTGWRVCPIIGKVEGSPAQFTKTFGNDPVDVNAVQTKVELPTSGARLVTPELERRLLSPFQKMIIPLQKLKITNSIIPADERDMLQQMVSPKSVSLEALAWTMAETIQRMKKVADAMVLRGDAFQAVQCYNNICVMRLYGCLLWEKVQSKDLPKEAILPASIAIRKNMDVMATSAFLSMNISSTVHRDLLNQRGDVLEVMNDLQDLGGCPVLDTAVPGLTLRKAGVELFWFETLGALCTIQNRDISLLEDTYANIVNLRQWRPE